MDNLTRTRDPGVFALPAFSALSAEFRYNENSRTNDKAINRRQKSCTKSLAKRERERAKVQGFAAHDEKYTARERKIHGKPKVFSRCFYVASISAGRAKIG